MEFTTNLELQSQTTRLVESRCQMVEPRQQRESHPLCCPFPRDLARSIITQTHHNSAYADSQVELFPLQSPLLGESWLVSFPPLNYMLKFSGSSYLMWDPVGRTVLSSFSRPFFNEKTAPKVWKTIQFWQPNIPFRVYCRSICANVMISISVFKGGVLWFSSQIRFKKA